MAHFTAEEFDYPVREVKLGKPESDEWKLFVDKNGIKVYAWLDKETGLFQWKVLQASIILEITAGPCNYNTPFFL